MRYDDSYGKTHGMVKARGVSMGVNFSILTKVGSTIETDDMSPTENSKGSFTIFVGSN